MLTVTLNDYCSQLNQLVCPIVNGGSIVKFLIQLNTCGHGCRSLCLALTIRTCIISTIVLYKMHMYNSNMCFTVEVVA